MFDIGENSKFYFFKILIGYKFDLVCGVFENYIDKIKLEILFLLIK